MQVAPVAKACGASPRMVQQISKSTFQPAAPMCTLPARLSSGSRSRRATVTVRADRDRGSGGFVTGFVLGGAIFGALGFLFAPQISAALLGDDQKLRLPRFMEESDPEATKESLRDKIAQLNAAIDEISGQLSANDEPAAGSNGATATPREASTRA